MIPISTFNRIYSAPVKIVRGEGTSIYPSISSVRIELLEHFVSQRRVLDSEQHDDWRVGGHLGIRKWIRDAEERNVLGAHLVEFERVERNVKEDVSQICVSANQKAEFLIFILGGSQRLDEQVSNAAIEERFVFLVKEFTSFREEGVVFAYLLNFRFGRNIVVVFTPSSRDGVTRPGAVLRRSGDGSAKPRECGGGG